MPPGMTQDIPQDCLTCACWLMGGWLPACMFRGMVGDGHEYLMTAIGYGKEYEYVYMQAGVWMWSKM
eukprot:1110482-Pelagomonas_calceolata.AAC.2